MGRFDGVLLVSDFDDTLVYTREALANMTPIPPVPSRSLDAIRFFIAEGGRFTVATGRGLIGIAPFIHIVPFNAPVIASNGATIYDFDTETCLYAAFLPDDVTAEVADILALFPDAGAEVYHANSHLEVVHTNQFTKEHARLIKASPVEISAITDSNAGDIVKIVLFAADPQVLQTELVRRGGQERYEIALSATHLLEITKKDSTKGNAVLELARLCGIDPAHVYCAGNGANDISMLRAAARGFAPANAIDEVKADPAVTVVSHCQDGAIADVVELLKDLYPEKP